MQRRIPPPHPLPRDSFIRKEIQTVLKGVEPYKELPLHRGVVLVWVLVSLGSSLNMGWGAKELVVSAGDDGSQASQGKHRGGLSGRAWDWYLWLRQLPV